MIDCFNGLRHDGIVGSYNNNSDIRYLGTTGTHSGKRFMTRSIQEGDTASAGQLHIVSTDMLRDTTGFTGNHIGITDIIQQRRFTVVDVSHHCYDRRTCYPVFFVIVFFVGIDGFHHFRTDIFSLKPELFGHDIDRFRIQALVD